MNNILKENLSRKYVMTTITCSELEKLPNYALIDVRSEKEFAESHIPGAVNCPILNNLERETVGILFKQQGQTAAMKKGFELFMTRFDEFCNNLLQKKTSTIVVYCARGGMRSRMTADIFLNKARLLQTAKEVNADINYPLWEEKLRLLKPVNAVQLVGGYKAYRNSLLEKLEKFNYDIHFIVLYGLTGVGKTEILQKLAKENAPVLDLEDLAQHRSSVFGSVGLQPRSQRMFEALLVQQLDEFKRNKITTILIEGEARKVGNIILPEKLFQRMNEGTKVFIEASLNDRVERIVKEYFNHPEKINHITTIIPQLKEALGNKRVEELLQLMEEQKYREVSRILLEEYYDKRYQHGLHNRVFSYTLKNTDLPTIKKLISERPLISSVTP